MSQTSLEQRLRSHYSDLDRLAVIGDGEFDPTPMVSVDEDGQRSNRWRLVGAAAAAVVLVGGLGYISLRPAPALAPAQVPAPPPTLSGTTDDDASVRLWSECMTAHGITFAPSRSEDGGLEFSGHTEEATQIAVDECQAALVQAGLAQP